MNDRVLDIPLAQVRPFRAQPRKYFSADGLKKLARSIETRGQETPGTVRRISLAEQPTVARYELIDGERRFRACQLAKVATFRAIVCEVTDAEDQFERAVVSNFGREGHPPMEIAAAVKRLRERYTVDETAERLAKSVGWVCQYQALLNLDERVQAMLDPALPEDKQLKFTIASRLAQRVSDHAMQVEAARHIVAKRLTLNAAELYLHGLGAKHGIVIGKSDARDQQRSIERFIARLEVDSEMILTARQIDFSEALGTKTAAQLRRLLDQLQACLDNVASIQDAVKSVQQGREAKARRIAMQRSA